MAAAAQCGICFLFLPAVRCSAVVLCSFFYCQVDALINLDMPLSVFYFPNRAHSLTQWKTGAPPRYLYERLTRLLTGTGGPNGNGAMRK